MWPADDNKDVWWCADLCMIKIIMRLFCNSNILHLLERWLISQLHLRVCEYLFIKRTIELQMVWMHLIFFFLLFFGPFLHLFDRQYARRSQKSTGWGEVLYRIVKGPRARNRTAPYVETLHVTPLSLLHLIAFIFGFVKHSSAITVHIILYHTMLNHFQMMLQITFAFNLSSNHVVCF